MHNTLMGTASLPLGLAKAGIALNRRPHPRCIAKEEQKLGLTVNSEHLFEIGVE